MAETSFSSSSDLDQLRATVAEFLPKIVAIRHDLHAHPELSGQETRTSGIVAQILGDAGISHTTGAGGMLGVIGTIDGTKPSDAPTRTIALRGDMDALPILEENDAISYKSENSGVMHACGHDGHTANLLGTALVLHALKHTFSGRVRLLFQPSEETVSGASSIISGGGLDGVDAIVMMHGWPDLPAGVVGTRTGPAMASSDTFSLTVHGRGGHAAYPHKSVDPILIGAHIVTALQSIVSREISPTDAAVITVAQFHAGTARNIIPDNAQIAGTIRTLNKTVRDSMFERIERVVAGVCAAMGATYTLKFKKGTPPVVNDASVSELIRQTTREVLGDGFLVELPDATMGAEDFAYYLEHVPGAMFRLGTQCAYLLHTPKYDFGDTALENGILVMAQAARNFLGEVGGHDR